MKNSITKKFAIILASSAFSFAVSFSVIAAIPIGTLEGADKTSIYGWVWDSDSYGHVIPVEISIYSTDSSEVLKTITVKADHYQEKLQKSIGDGYHGFKYSVDWEQFDEENFQIIAHAVTETDRVFLGKLTYSKDSCDFALLSTSDQGMSPETSAPQKPDTTAPAPQGPGEISVSRQAPGLAATTSQSSDKSSSNMPTAWQTGPGAIPKKSDTIPERLSASLGMFTVTGYCSCNICCPSSITKLTYSETEPQPEHTISADINVFPIGTRLMLNGIIYTVEDIGSNVVENRIDIYYATHEEALAHGVTTEEVFSVP